MKEDIINAVKDKLGSAFTKRVSEYKDKDLSGTRESIPTLLKNMENSFFDLSEALWIVSFYRLHKDWGFKKLDEYLDANKIGRRTARYLISIWWWFGIAMYDHPEVLQKVKGLGWTKVSMLVGIVDHTNVDEWATKADALNVKQLARLIKEYKGEDTEKDAMTRMMFVLAEEQAELVNRALELAGKAADSNKKGHLISLICMDYLNTNTNSSKKDPAQILAAMEVTMNIKILAVRDDKIVYDGTGSLGEENNEPEAELRLC